MDLSPLQIDRTARKARRRRGGFPWLPIFLLAAVAGLGFVFRKPLMREVDRLRLPKVQISKVYRPDARAASASSGTAANGYIIAKTRAALSADTPGRIVELNVEEGSVVKAGDVVARLYSEELEAALTAAKARITALEASVVSAQAQVRSAQAALPDLEAQVKVAETRVISAQASIESSAAVAHLAGIELERSKELLASDVGTQERVDRAVSEHSRSAADLERARAELDTQQANVAAARTSLERARADVATSEAAVAQAQAQIPVQRALMAQAAATLAKTVVRAPFDGVVVLKDAEVGEVVSPNAQGSSSRGSVATMVDFDSLEVQIELPETSIAAARPGGAAQVFLDAYPNRAYAGRVDRVWPTANRQKGTIEVRAVSYTHLTLPTICSV